MTNPHSQLSSQSTPLSTSKAQRRTIQMGTITVQVFLLPDGPYCLSQTEVAAIIGRAEYSIRQFLNSKSFKALLGAGSESGISVEPVAVEGANKPVNPLSLHVASLYWHHWAQKGNELAQTLCQALMKYSLHQLADDAFGFRRTAEEKQQQLADDLAQPNLPGVAVAPDPSLQLELRAATQALVSLSQQNAQLAAQNVQLLAENSAFRARAAYRSEQISFHLAKSELVSPSGQVYCAPNMVAEKITDILQLRSEMDGWNWIVAHPEIIGQQSEWETFSSTFSVPAWPKTAVNKLLKLAYTEAENTGCARYLN